jgi:hypothetical protein
MVKCLSIILIAGFILSSCDPWKGNTLWALEWTFINSSDSSAVDSATYSVTIIPDDENLDAVNPMVGKLDDHGILFREFNTFDKSLFLEKSHELQIVVNDTLHGKILDTLILWNDAAFSRQISQVTGELYNNLSKKTFHIDFH